MTLRSPAVAWVAITLPLGDCLRGTGTDSGRRWVGHNGGAPGVSADFRYYPDAGVAVIILANLSRAAMPVSRWLNRLVVGNLASM